MCYVLLFSPSVAGVNTVAQDNKQQEASVNAEMLQRDAVVKAGDGNSDGTPTSILHHNTTGTPENSAEKMTKTNNSAGGGHSKFNGVNAGGGGGGGAIIKRGQEVSFRLGQRQGKPLGLCVKKLKSGTLPLCEELLPSRFVGVVVVAPRMIAAATAAGAATSSTGGGGVGGIIETVRLTANVLLIRSICPRNHGPLGTGPRYDLKRDLLTNRGPLTISRQLVSAS